MTNITLIAAQVVGEIANQNKILATAESCTGGWIAEALTSVPGSSNCFDRGFVTYSNDAKIEMIGVANDLIETHGAVSEQVAIAMAEGAIKNSNANIAVATTGIAGPDGGSSDKPVGTVWIAWASFARNEIKSVAKCFHFDGDRTLVREQAVITALEGVIDIAVNA